MADSAVQKCIDSGTAATPDLGEWYQETCPEWVAKLQEGYQAVEVYNHEAAVAVPPQEIIALPTEFGSGDKMWSDSVAFERIARALAQAALDPDAAVVAVSSDAAAAGLSIVDTGNYVATLFGALKLAVELLEKTKDAEISRAEGIQAIQDSPLPLLGVGGSAIAGLLQSMLGLTEEELERLRKEREDLAALADADLEDLAAAEGVTYERLVFREQCFLLAKIFEIVNYKKEVIEKEYGKALPYMGTSPLTNACLQVEGDPFDFTNVMTQNSLTSALFNMETQEIASLQPQIRLYKVREDDDGVEYQEEFNFDAYASPADVDSVFMDKTKRGFGVGIKKFSFTYDGSNFFAAKKSIKAKLHIFANSFSELLKDRGGTLTNYRYTDLALRTGKINAQNGVCEDETVDEAALNEIADNLDALNFRLKAVVGWAYPSGDKSLFNSRSASGANTILEAISESYVTLNLLPTVHSFDIDDQGRVNFIIHYRAWVDTFFSQPYFNIFYDAVATQKLMRRKLLYEAYKEECTPKEFAKIKELDAKSGAPNAEKAANLKSLMGKLDDSGGIFFIPLSYDELKSFQTAGPYYESTESIEIKNSSDATGGVSQELLEQYTAALGTSPEAEKTKESLKIALEANNPEWNHVSFFYVSDLVDVVLSSIEEYLNDYSDSGSALDELRERADDDDPDLKIIKDCQYEKEKVAITRFYKNFKRYRVVLGPVEIIDPRDNGQATYISLGDIPISVKYFMQWLNEKMTNFDVSTYFLSQFLLDFFNDLLDGFLNDASCFTFNTKQKISMNQATFTSYPGTQGAYPGLPLMDELTNNIVEQENPPWSRVYLDQAKALGKPLLNISGPAGSPRVQGNITEEINYLAFSAGRTPSSRPMDGNREEDEKAGIFHYILGQPRGIVKNIKLTKTDAKYQAEVRWEQDGYDGLQQLRMVYDTTVECYSNVRTFPGTYIFVDPRGWDPGTTLGAEDLKNISRYGIGGYCMIIRSEHTFGPGEANSTLTAKWVQEVGPTTDPLGGPRTSGDGTTTPCTKIIADAEAAAAAAAAEVKNDTIAKAITGDPMGPGIMAGPGGGVQQRKSAHHKQGDLENFMNTRRRDPRTGNVAPLAGFPGGHEGNAPKAPVIPTTFGRLDNPYTPAVDPGPTPRSEEEDEI
jgi:hypothetical protein